jgi:putative ABC transport system substrate-binding protein
MISRRAWLGAAALALAAAARRAAAQPAAGSHRIGFLGGASAAGYAPLVDALRGGLREHGYVEGRNLTIEYRWADGAYDRLPGLAAELLRLKVDLIVTQGTPAALAAKRTTATVPIVMAIVGNPVETGIVDSLPRPGANITGSSFFWSEVNAKRVELLRTLSPGLARASALMNPGNPAMDTLWLAMEERARVFGMSLQRINVRTGEEMEGAIKAARAQSDALVIVDDGLFIASSGRLAELATRHRLPTIGFREYVEAGGLLAYGVDFPDIWRRSALLVDKVLKGAKPATLPIQQATRFEFVVNLKAAKAIGLVISPSLVARADHVIGE